MADYIPSYERILETVGEEPTHMFKTERGSTYGSYKDASSVRDRSGSNHKDTTVGVQPRSSITVFMSPKDVNVMAGLFQNPDLATQFVNESFDKETKTGKASLKLSEDFGPRKAGSVMHKATYTSMPQKGLIPVEINRSTSPVGSTGEGIHWGNKITEMLPNSAFSQTYRSSGKVPITTPAQQTPGRFDTLQHTLNPLKLANGGLIDKAVKGGSKLI